MRFYISSGALFKQLCPLLSKYSMLIAGKKESKLSSRNVPELIFQSSPPQMVASYFFPLFSAQIVASREHHVGVNYAEHNFYSHRFHKFFPLQIVASCEHHVGGWVASRPKLESNDKTVEQTRRQIICFLRCN